MRKTIHISIILLFTALSIQGQEYSERGTPTPTATRMLMHVSPAESSLLLNGDPIEVNDMIGFFYDSLGTVAIAGLTIWNGFPNDNYIYGDTTDPTYPPGAKEGFDENEIMQIKVFDDSEGCIVENGDYTLQSNTITFRKNTNDTLFTWVGNYSDIIYPEIFLCANRTDTIAPIFVGGVRPVIFSTDVDGLKIDTNTGAIVPGESTPGVYKVFFETLSCLNDTSVTITIENNDIPVEYPQGSICKDQDGALPPLSNDPGLSLLFTAKPEGLIIDSNTGDISVAASTPGVYEIHINSNRCITTTSATVEIIDSIPLSESDLRFIKYNCGEETTADLIATQHVVPTSNYSLTFIPDASVRSQSGQVNFTNLEPGNYILDINTVDGCTKTIPTGFTTKSCSSIISTLSSGDIVITPLTEGEHQSITFPCNKEIKIYNRNSQLVKTLSDEKTWNGKNEEGNYVRSGLYIIFCGENARLGEVTVVLE